MIIMTAELRREAAAALAAEPDAVLLAASMRCVLDEREVPEGSQLAAFLRRAGLAGEVTR